MNESGPIRKTEKDLPARQGYTDFAQVSPRIWLADRRGKHLLLKTAPSRDAASEQLLQREYALTCNLQHPFIASALDYDADAPVGPAIVMEYVEGRTLCAFSQEHPSKTLRCKVFGELLDAVVYLHRKGLLHNDLKPENVLVTNVSDDVKLIDFGLAETDADYLNQRLGGTPGATAPEVLRGPGGERSTAAADIYALGGILSLLFPKRYRAIVRKCRQENPARRYQDVESLHRSVRRRDRLPQIVAAILIVLALLAAALVPDRIRTAREKAAAEAAESARQALIREVQNQMLSWYQAAADSISDPALVPYRDFAYPVRNTFAMQAADFQRSLDSLRRLVADTVYERLVLQLTDLMNTLPTLSDLYERGEHSEAEHHWYLMQVVRGESFSPYRPH